MKTRVRTRLASLLGVSLGLAVLELLVRQVYQLSTVEEPGYGPIAKPGSTIVWGREGHGVSHWLAHGIRQPPSPQRSGLPILVLGDSQTEALMLDDDEVCTAVADARLNSAAWAAPPILNAGRSSASLADYVVHVDRFEHLLHPTWTVLILQENDLGSDSFEPAKTHFVLGSDGELSGVFVPSRARHGADAALWALRQHSMLVGYAFVRFGELRKASEAEPPLFHAGSVARAPIATEPDYPIEKELALASTAHRGRVSFLLLSTFDPHAPEVATPVERRFADACAAGGFHCATPRDRYAAIRASGQAPYGHANSAFNWGHLNRIGHRAVGEVLATHIQKLHENGLL